MYYDDADCYLEKEIIQVQQLAAGQDETAARIGLCIPRNFWRTAASGENARLSNSRTRKTAAVIVVERVDALLYFGKQESRHSHETRTASRSPSSMSRTTLFTSSLHASGESKDDDWSLKNCGPTRSVHATVSLTIHCMAFVGCCRRRRAGHRATGDRRKTAVFLFHGSQCRKCHCRAKNAMSIIPTRLTNVSATSTTHSGRRTQFHCK